MAGSAPGPAAGRQLGRASPRTTHAMRPRRFRAPSLLRASNALLFASLTTLLSLTPANCFPSQLHVVCKDNNSKICITWQVDLETATKYAKEFYRPNDKENCGLSDLKRIPPHRKFIAIKPFDEGSADFYCNVLKFNKEPVILIDDPTSPVIRTPRQANYRIKGRYRGQTQSQYLSIDRGNGKDEGKAEAHSAADSSRAIVSGNSGMGQAQSQTIYDPSCEDCVGRSDTELASLTHGPRDQSNGQGAYKPNLNNNFNRQGEIPGSNRDVPGSNIHGVGQNLNGPTPSQFSTNQQKPTDNNYLINQPGGSDGRNGLSQYSPQPGQLGNNVNGQTQPSRFGTNNQALPPQNILSPGAFGNEFLNRPGSINQQQPATSDNQWANGPLSNGNQDMSRIPTNGNLNGGTGPGGGISTNIPNGIQQAPHNVYSPSQSGSPNNGLLTNQNIPPPNSLTTQPNGNAFTSYPGTGGGSSGPNGNNQGNPFSWPVLSDILRQKGAGSTYFCCVVGPDNNIQNLFGGLYKQPPYTGPVGASQTPSTGQIGGTGKSSITQYGGPGQTPTSQYGGTGQGPIAGGQYGGVVPGTTPGGPYGGTGQSQTPGGQYGGTGQGSTPGGQYGGTGQSSTPGGQYGGTGQGPISGGQYGSVGPISTPGGQYGGTGQGSTPGGQYGGTGQGPIPGGQYGGTGQGPTSGGQYGGIGQGLTPGGQYVGTGQGSTPGGQYGGTGQGSTPGGQYGGTSLGPTGQYGGPGQTTPGQFGGTGQLTGPNGGIGQSPSGQFGGTSQVPSSQYGGTGHTPTGQYGGAGQMPGGQTQSGPYGGGQSPPGQYGGVGLAPAGPYGESGQTPTGQYGGPGQTSAGQYGGSGRPIGPYGGMGQSPGGQYGGSGQGLTPGGQYGGTGQGSTPSGQYGGTGQGSTPGGQYGGTGQGPTPGGQYGGTGQGSTPGGQYGVTGQGPTPGGQYGGTGQSSTPGGQYGVTGQGPTPGGQYGGTGQGSTPGGQYGGTGQGPTPGGQYGGTGQGSTPGGQYGGAGQGSTPGGQYGETGQSQSPGGQYGGTGQGRPPGGPFGGAGQGSTPGGQYGGTGQGGTPGGQYGGTGQGSTPGGQYGGTGQGPVSGGQYGGTGQGSTQGGQYGGIGQGPTSGGQYGGTSQGSIPGGQYGGTSQGPAGQFGGPSQTPTGQYGVTGPSPVGQQGGTGQVPTGQYGSTGPGNLQSGTGPYGTTGQNNLQAPTGPYVTGQGPYGGAGQMPNGPYAGSGQTTQAGNYYGGQGVDQNGINKEYGGSGEPLNVVDPNSISSFDDYDSEAQASVAQAGNGTTALATSKGGNDKGRAQTQVEGTYTGTGSFSANAEISDDNKAAQSHVSGSKKGASSSAEGRGRKNKSQASVKLGSETGSILTDSQSSGDMHSSSSQVQGSVKGGMADAQAKGPGSTSSQAQIGFTPFKEEDKAKHDQLKTPFEGGGTASAQSSRRMGTSQSQLRGTFKYGINYNGAAQAGSSLDKDAVFSNLLPFDKIDVFDESNKNINVEVTTTEKPLEVSISNTEYYDLTTTEKNENEYPQNTENDFSDHLHIDHHKTEEEVNATTLAPPVGNRRSFQSNYGNNGADYEYSTDKEDTTEEYEIDDGFGAEGNENAPVEQTEYANYDDIARDTTHESLQSVNKKPYEIKQTTGGNTQHIILGSLNNHDAKIIQRNSEHPDETRVYQPGEKVPGMGGYIIPAGFTGSVKSVASKDKTYVVGSKYSPSQAQTVNITPGTGKIKYVYPSSYGKNVNPKELRSLYHNKPNDNRYVSVSKSVTRDLDSESNIRKQYSHTYYTKSSSCGYFTFTCTMVSSAEGKKKVCKPKIPTNPDGTPMRC